MSATQVVMCVYLFVIFAAVMAAIAEVMIWWQKRRARKNREAYLRHKRQLFEERLAEQQRQFEIQRNAVQDRLFGGLLDPNPLGAWKNHPIKTWADDE